MKRAEANDTVRIKGYSKKLNGKLGVVDSTDGEYVYVFPNCQPNNTKYPVELYQSEVEVM